MALRVEGLARRSDHIHERGELVVDGVGQGNHIREGKSTFRVCSLDLVADGQLREEYGRAGLEGDRVVAGEAHIIRGRGGGRSTLSFERGAVSIVSAHRHSSCLRPSHRHWCLM